MKTQPETNKSESEVILFLEDYLKRAGNNLGEADQKRIKLVIEKMKQQLYEDTETLVFELQSLGFYDMARKVQGFDNQSYAPVSIQQPTDGKLGYLKTPTFMRRLK